MDIPNQSASKASSRAGAYHYYRGSVGNRAQIRGANNQTVEESPPRFNPDDTLPSLSGKVILNT